MAAGNRKSWWLYREQGTDVWWNSPQIMKFHLISCRIRGFDCRWDVVEGGGVGKHHSTPVQPGPVVASGTFGATSLPVTKGCAALTLCAVQVRDRTPTHQLSFPLSLSLHLFSAELSQGYT